MVHGDKFMDKSEFYLDHEVRIRMQELCYKKLNTKLDILIAVVLIPIILHYCHLI